MKNSVNKLANTVDLTIVDAVYGILYDDLSSVAMDEVRYDDLIIIVASDDMYSAMNDTFSHMVMDEIDAENSMDSIRAITELN